MIVICLCRCKRGCGGNGRLILEKWIDRMDLDVCCVFVR